MANYSISVQTECPYCSAEVEIRSTGDRKVTSRHDEEARVKCWQCGCRFALLLTLRKRGMSAQHKARIEAARAEATLTHYDHAHCHRRRVHIVRDMAAVTCPDCRAYFNAGEVQS
jgi:hypothetical protein